MVYARNVLDLTRFPHANVNVMTPQRPSLAAAAGSEEAEEQGKGPLPGWGKTMPQDVPADNTVQSAQNLVLLCCQLEH